MILALLLWTLAVGAVWWFADAVLAFVTPGSAWLAANPDFGWLAPVSAFLGTLGTSAAVIVWLIGVVLILLIGRLRPAARRARAALAYEDWQKLDQDGQRPVSRGWRRRDDGRDDDDERYRRRRRRYRDDDDDDDDD